MSAATDKSPRGTPTPMPALAPVLRPDGAGGTEVEEAEGVAEVANAGWSEERVLVERVDNWDEGVVVDEDCKLDGGAEVFVLGVVTEGLPVELAPLTMLVEITVAGAELAREEGLFVLGTVGVDVTRPEVMLVFTAVALLEGALVGVATYTVI